MNESSSFISSSDDGRQEQDQFQFPNLDHLNKGRLTKETGSVNSNIFGLLSGNVKDNFEQSNQFPIQQNSNSSEDKLPYTQNINKDPNTHKVKKPNMQRRKIQQSYHDLKQHEFEDQKQLKNNLLHKTKKQIQSEKSKEIRQYFSNFVSPTFQPLIFNLAKYRPQDILTYCLKWFKDKKMKDESESQDQLQQNGQHKYSTIQIQQFEKYRRQRYANLLRKRRYGVCTQVSGPYNKRKEFILKNGTKKEQQTHLRILFFISNSFLFKNFNEIQINSLIESMIERETVQDQLIIKQGQSGDSMYIVDAGYFECFQHVQGSQEPRILKYFLPGDTFGQLLLLHNSKRSASVVSKKPGKLYSLSRQVYKHYKKMSIVTKKILYVNVLKKIELFRNFTPDQYEKICDVMTEVVFEAGKFVIIEGDLGNKFYIILEGVAVALKGPQEKITQCYKEGDYFGELALLNDNPRNASVKCLTKSTLVYLTQSVFKRIIDKDKIENNYEQKYQRKPAYTWKKNQ